MLQKFCKSKYKSNRHNDWNKALQNLANNLTGLHFSTAFLNGLICRSEGYFRMLV